MKQDYAVLDEIAEVMIIIPIDDRIVTKNRIKMEQEIQSDAHNEIFEETLNLTSTCGHETCLKACL
jgi:hypothetical protein